MKPLSHLAAILLVTFLTGSVSHARDWYVSAETGKGKRGTKEEPAKDVGNIVSKLQDGDRIFIAQGVYLGRGNSGHDAITVPVEIYAGWDGRFEKRDPWGAHRTVLSGLNASKNWQMGYRLLIDLRKWKKNKKHKIVVDGIIVDNGDRNQYASTDQNRIVRKANPRTGHNPTPESGGIRIAPWRHGDVIVRNCVVINTAPTDGAFSIWGHQASKALVENNLAVNNTGNGFSLHTSFHASDESDQPRFVFKKNTSLFNEKHDPYATYGGSSLKLDAGVKVAATNNVFGLNDYYGVDNARQATGLILNNSLFVGNLVADYLEFDAKMNVVDLEDESELLDEAQGNVVQQIELPVSSDWSSKYLSREIVDRQAAEADVKAINTNINAVRAMLGLNVRGSDLAADSPVWLPRIGLEDALKLGAQQFMNQFGAEGFVSGVRD